MSARNNSYGGVFRVVSVGAEKTFPSGFRKIELVVCDDDPKFTQTFPVEFTGDRVDRALAYREGDHVAIAFSIQGHEYNGRRFVTIRGFKIERAVKVGGEPTVGNAPAPAPAPTPPPPPQPVQAPLPVREESVEDLPF